jgi:ATP-dependent DNA helicase RecG
MARRLTQLARIPVATLEGVGPKSVTALEEMGITTVLDLLTHYPRRWLDRTREARIADLRPGMEGVVVATVRAVHSRRTRNGRALVEVSVRDETGVLTCTFFNQPWRAKQLHAGMEVTLFGKLDVYRGKRQVVNPVVDLLGDATGRIVPVYPQSEKAGLTTRDLRVWVQEALDRAGELAEPLADEVLSAQDLVSRDVAFRQIHAPETMGAKEVARKRLAFDELLRLQTVMVLRKKALEREAKAIRHIVGDGPGATLVPQFHAGLPFTLTGAQRRAIAEIETDLGGPHPMHRLLQGDVGSGKTLVAVSALLAAVQGGHQGALMAPTEVLAEQHFLSVRPLLSGLKVGDEGSLFGEREVRVELLTARTTAGERRELLPRLAQGDVDLLIGTHALIVDTVEFADLGVVVIDEQHRFGVEQRAKLRDKARGHDPDVLVMTATPIPRTAAMTVFGDLDMTVLDELPPGRTAIDTTWAKEPLALAMAWDTVRREVAAGRQAYVVCPLVEESEKVQAASATAELERLAADDLSGLRLGLLHGQLPGSEKEAVMGRFRGGELDVLVATTVVEVGVDVPNATVMVIEDADHFGMAQLHQLRGRVGRGVHPSHCFLLGGTDEEGRPSSDEVAARLGAMERSTDGFELAEVDLELRGEGTILGTRQKGRSDLKLASLRRDKKLVMAAREVAFLLVGPDGRGLARHEILAEEVRDLVDEEEAEFLFKS